MHVTRLQRQKREELGIRRNMEEKMAEKFPKSMNNNQSPDPSSENAKENKHTKKTALKRSRPTAETKDKKQILEADRGESVSGKVLYIQQHQEQ